MSDTVPLWRFNGGGDEYDDAVKEKHGVLLYYKFTPPIADLDDLYSFYESNCSSLGLIGRVRISSQGVNVTVGGRMSSLEKHIAAVKENRLFDGTDFKLAACEEPMSKKVAEECGFTSLSIRIVKELVTLSSNPLFKAPAISNVGRHLSAVEFHSVIKNTGEILREDPIDSGKIVLLDARNLYETRIGKFETPNVETLDPGIRQYSDLPTWIDDHVEQLRGSSILMYCTGGIRCEMASSYIRSKGDGFGKVFQLYGGIQRYLEQFPDGGFFKGKNFVFDHRIAVGSSNGSTVGKCLLCGTLFDDYSSRCRCAFCRMLVLICNSCQKENAKYVCELCQRHEKRAESASVDAKSYSDRSTTCDHGHCSLGAVPQIDQSTGNSLRLGQICVALFIWAKHWQLNIWKINRMYPLLIFSFPASLIASALLCGLLLFFVVNCNAGVGSSRKLRILCLHGFRQNASGFKGRSASLTKKLKSIAELVFIDAPHELPFIYQASSLHEPVDGELSSQRQDPPPSVNCTKKYAWLVAKEFLGQKGGYWERSEVPFDPLQFQQQTEGFTESLTYLNTVFSEKGPFDGILGFSQGAAMGALICAKKGTCNVPAVDFRFVILCSGFAVNLAGSSKGSINIPSLHIFGNLVGKDRQIPAQASLDLASYFEEGSRMIIQHNSGHLIPTMSPSIDDLRTFLDRFV